jgi:hypothetical protein
VYANLVSRSTSSRALHRGQEGHPYFAENRNPHVYRPDRLRSLLTGLASLVRRMLKVMCQEQVVKTGQYGRFALTTLTCVVLFPPDGQGAR